MTEDRTNLEWAKLAATARAAREARGLSQGKLAELAGVSEGSVQNLESGKPRSRMPQTVAKIEPYLGWGAGSARAILDGGEPIPAAVPGGGSAGPAATDRLRSKLPLRVVDELESDDPLIDSQVIQLPGTGGARMTVVVHGRPDATPEEIQEALLAWRKAERKLHRQPDDDTEDPAHAANGS
ncbi:helix-turn-helix domain-containing protein [Streptomyces rishiriensis]|uniref:helix-turn-helix domain-containing protein n=1 Tax=Streptomyces rishiriensis TaxID=68264 RepID=UPI001C3F9FE0|nr:helix-turn-helix transcriptional regulator [Streptomyces rishiriensis]